MHAVFAEPATVLGQVRRDVGQVLRADLPLLVQQLPSDAPVRPEGRVSLRVLPYGILDTEEARTQATGFSTDSMSICGSCSPAGSATTPKLPPQPPNSTSRTALTLWLAQAADQLGGLYLSGAAARTELHLVLEAAAPGGRRRPKPQGTGQKAARSCCYQGDRPSGVKLPVGPGQVRVSSRSL